MTLRRKLLFFPVLAIGILVLVVAIKTRPDIPVKPAQSKARPVDVLTLSQQTISPVVTGFGRVTPKLTWQAIAEVNGKVIYRNPALEKGSILPAGTELLRIDPTDYQLAVAQAQADVSAKQARLAKLDLDSSNLKTTLNIEKRRLALSKDELTRKKNLRQKGLTSQSDLDTEQQAYLSQQTRVQDLESQLKVLPDERLITEAELDASQLALTQAERDLEKTHVVLPVNSRIAEVNIEKDQFVTPQQIMLVAHGLEAVEVDAQVSIHDMQTLFDSLNAASSQSQSGNQSDAQSAANGHLARLTANVALSSGSFNQTWSANVARLSDTVNLNQATVGVILEIPLNLSSSQSDVATPNPLAALPSLVNGMFVQATIEGQPVAHWVIPEQALRGDKVYLMEEGVLTVEPVDVLFRHDDLVAIAGDLKDGQQLVVNDLLPAVPGMALRTFTLDGERVVADDDQATNDSAESENAANEDAS
ncbi:efflux RND transporter periplasmic adaptor subunit [Enterovibrio norvegicus]|uniref:efflux RND transporter periplasmic adaptor subunit n=1 Tax=Enterovibrio norvegicus TaxID=188144 RepID=UPI000C8246E7|nr:HlyD family secretion protein [Enterovibrio norvegicus]PMN66522.1 acriflavin resistance protein [Enterovibrio norvegicus]